MATTVLGLKTFAASDPVNYNEINDNYNKIDNGVKTALQGRAAQNLLDNSNFQINQRGTSSTTTDGDYIADRWIVNISNNAATVSIGSGGITLKPTSSNYVCIYQKFEHYAEMSGKVYTLGVCINGMWESTTFTMANEASGKPLPSGLRVYSTGNTFQVMIRNISCATPVTIQRVALYEGSSTADTLPAYKPKGYAAELAECQRYYWMYWQNNNMAVGNGYMNTTDTANITFEFPTKMRVAPTIKFEDISTLRVMCVDGLKGVTAYSVVKSTQDQIMVGFTLNAASTQFTPCTMRSNGGAKIEFSADL